MVINLAAGMLGVAISIFGAVALWHSSHKAYKLKIKYKYIKSNAVNITSPGFVLIFLGVLVATLPLTLPLIEKYLEWHPNISVSLHDDTKVAAAKKPSVENNSISLLVPLDNDQNLAPIGVSVLVDAAKHFSSKLTPKVTIASYGFTSDANGKNDADKAAKQLHGLLLNCGIKKCVIDDKPAVQFEQAGTGLYVTVQGGK